jgi:hypothetical protein
LLLPTLEHAASVVIGLMPLCMEQPDKEAFQVLLHERDQYINQCIIFLLVLLQCMEDSKMMHNAGGQMFEIEKTQPSIKSKIS